MEELDTLVLGKVIRQARIRAGMTQEVLSGLAGIARSHLSMIETGDKQANLVTVWRIAQALGMRPSELICLVEEYKEE
ncbi:MAG: helix-turn-helix transcriptional regulator [Clostridia bacterium]|nr:helix-turn-helix transcriptional regulator [Clostridia bacterium]